MKSISEALDIIKTRNKKVYVIIGIAFILLFMLSFAYGYNLYNTNRQEAMNYIKMITEDKLMQTTLYAFQEKDYFAGFLLILGNNIKSVFILLFSGILFIFPTLISASQAILLGTIMGITSAINPVSFWHVMLTSLVACLEFSAIFIACYEGTNLGLSIFRKKGKNARKKDKKGNKTKGFGQTFSECLKISVLIIAILTTAAIIETAGIAVFGTNSA